MSGDPWSSAAVADRFVDDVYASPKGRIRTLVMHRQLLEHLPSAPTAILDVGGGAGHQCFRLAELGYDVTLLDASEAMLDKARHRLEQLPSEAQRRVTLLEGDGVNAAQIVGGRRFDAVLCHGVLGYLEDPEPMIDQLCLCAAPDGVVSIVTRNATAMAIRPALEQRWEDALAEFDATHQVNVLGIRDRADTVEEMGESLQRRGVEPLSWYGVWLFADWFEFTGTELDLSDPEKLTAMAAVEFEAARRDPYRQLSRVFHLVGRKASN